MTAMRAAFEKWCDGCFDVRRSPDDIFYLAAETRRYFMLFRAGFNAALEIGHPADAARPGSVGASQTCAAGSDGSAAAFSEGATP